MRMNLRALFLCASAAVAVAAADDQVLVLSAQKQMLHASPAASPASAGFTSAGLVELAMDALGLATGHVVRPLKATVTLPAAQNPLQADVFQHADAYALVFVHDGDGAVLDAIVAGTTFTEASYHNVFPLNHRRGAAQKIPDVIANEFSGASGGVVKCAGSTAVCSATKLQTNTVAADAARVNKVLAENAFLHKDVAEDARFAQELAQVGELTASLSSSDNAAAALQSLYVVGFSDVQALESSKRIDASKALAAHVSAFLSALQKTHAAAGAQVVASREGSPSPKQLKAMKQLQDVTSYSRLLASLATPGPADSGSSDDDDEDSGSTDEDEESNANATSSSNSTAAAVGQVSMEEIAEYQIVLWTSVLLGVALLLAVLALCNMNTGRDSLLYAKFITDAGHRKGD